MHSSSQQKALPEWAAAILLILLSTAASYLLLANQMGFTSDDWYLVYAGKIGGFAKFWDVFISDRPARSFFAGAVYDLFGLRVTPYVLLSYLLRVGGAMAMFWLLRLVWPRQGRWNVALAVLLAVYPGWGDQPIPFDVQSHLLGFGLMVLSTAMTIKGLRAAGWVHKAAWILPALAAQLVALLMMEYYIGMEGLRLAILALLCFERRPRNAYGKPFLAYWRRWIFHAAPYLLVSTGFLVWRMFIFDNTRGATNVSSMFAGFAQSPVMRGLWSLVYLVQDFFNIILLAWFVPLYQNTAQLRLRESLVALGVAALVAVVFLLVLRWLRDHSDAVDLQPGPESEHADGLEMIAVGILGVIFSILPVILGSRHVVFPSFNRFTLPGSVGAILVIGGLLSAFSHGRARWGTAAVLLALALMSNIGNTYQYASGWDTIRDFWWQVSWRAPQIEQDTVLGASYPETGIYEDYYIWGPANLIYYPKRQPAGDRAGLDRTPLAGIVLRTDTVQAIRLDQDAGTRERRGFTSMQDLSRFMMLSMPLKGACVHIFDGKAPELSQQEDTRAYLVADSSKITYIQTDAEPHIPPGDLFGEEPPHTWCYYYQKASLARQRGDWEEVARLGSEAIRKDLRPLDWVEWMPFVQAYAYLGRYADADKIVPILSDVPYLKSQACARFREDAYQYGKTYPAGQQYLRDTFCQ